MYYESKREKRIEKLLYIVLMIVIIALLCVLIIKLDAPASPYQSMTSDYNAEKLSTKSEESVDNQTPKTIENIVKSVVGISKLQQNGHSIFLDNS